MGLTETQRIEVLIMLGCGDKTRSQMEVCEMFNNKYPHRPPISQGTVSKIERKFRETGTVANLSKTGRPKISEDIRLNALLSVRDNPHASTREIGLNFNISHFTVNGILKAEKYHPYKVHALHELTEDDPDRRNQFCENMMNRCNMNPLFIENVLFSDEATFMLNGTVNRQTCRYWSDQNPHWAEEVHTQFPQKVNVWAGIIGRRILGPYFFDATLNGNLYLQFLQEELVPALAVLFPNEEDPDLPSDNIWFQQDGAPPHYAANVRRYLEEVFPGRWIGRRGAIEWPPRSPDLTPLDFFLWGYLKSKVYLQKPNNLEELRERIRDEIQSIPGEILQNVLEETVHRFAHCQAVDGQHFEHLI